MPSSRSWTPRSERSVSKTAELEVKLQQAVDLRLSRRRGPESSEDLSSEGGQTTRGALSSCTSWESRSLTSRSSTSSTASLSQPARAGPWHCATSVQGRVREAGTARWETQPVGLLQPYTCGTGTSKRGRVHQEGGRTSSAWSSGGP